MYCGKKSRRPGGFFMRACTVQHVPGFLSGVVAGIG
jgi:hypothetical protein